MALIVSEARKGKRIHLDRIPITLNECSPTPLNPEALTQQLNDLGLHCEETHGERLKKSIEDVISKIKLGELTTFGVYRDGGKLRTEQLPNEVVDNIFAKDALSMLIDKRFTKEANGSWEEGPTEQYTSKLLVVQERDNYRYLKENRPDFPYAEEPEKEIKKRMSTAEAIKEMFTEAATTCTAATVQGIDKTTLEATFSNALADVNESTIKEHYEITNNRVIMLVYDYDPQNHNCAGVGVVTCEWHLEIKDYKDKKKKAKTVLNISARSVLYEDTGALDVHYAMAIAREKGACCLVDRSIPLKSEVKVYDSLPPANVDTFVNSLPCKTDTEYAEVMVFYSSNLQEVGFIDNTLSEAEVTYSKSLTSGFMTQTTVGISAEINFEINAEVYKAGAKIGFNVSLTDQWSKSQTETISFRIPAGKKAFLYQVTILCARLRLNAKTGKYSYVEYGKFLTDAYKTSEKNIV
ncbi:MAG: hypothetical protein K2O32_13870 [Acetatifactor sp.]|nr:hypothetical protein [Acetatifactor sp.]